jgi:antitoxin (DNA-binding transcriptional repressor) of toxin-antitoxin stability system
MKSLNVATQSATLRELVAMAQEDEVILTEGDNPVAKVVSFIATAKVRVLGLHPGALQETEDFNAPLPDSFWLGAK